jgi:hypothetical protein
MPPWVPVEPMDQAVRIRPELVTGVLFTETGGTAKTAG